MPVYGHQLMSVRCLVKGKNAELKRRDGKSDEPGIYQLHAYVLRGATGSVGL